VDILAQAVLLVDYEALPAAVEQLEGVLLASPHAPGREEAARKVYEVLLRCNDYYRKPHLMRWFYGCRERMAGGLVGEPRVQGVEASVHAAQ
jgi:hypothetical protein